MESKEDSPWQRPVVAVLNEWGSVVASGLVPKPNSPHYRPALRVFSACEEGNRPQSIYIDGAENIEKLHMLLSHMMHLGGAQPSPETRLATARSNWEYCTEKIEAMRKVLPQFGIVNIDGDCAFELTGNGRGFSWESAMDYMGGPEWEGVDRVIALNSFAALWPTEEDGNLFLRLCEHSGA